MATRSVVVRLRAEVAQYRAGMREAATATTSVGTAAERSSQTASTALGRMTQHARAHSKSWRTVGKAAMVGGAAVVAGVGLAVKSYADFDQQMSAVKAATHETAGNMSILRDAAITAGADTAFSAGEAANAIEELAKAGVSTSDIMKGGLTGSLSLAAAGAMGVGDAAELAATAMTQFKLSGDKIPHIADLLAAGAGKAQGSVHDLGMALKQAGLVANSTGLTIEETTGGLAAFAAAGLVGSDAGTSFKSMLQRLTPQSAQAKKQMAELGISAYDAQGQFIGLSEFAGNLQTSMADLTPEARNAAMTVMFGSDAVRAATVLYDQGADGIDKWTAAVDDSGYAAETAALRQDNLAGDIEKLGGSIDSAFLKSGSGMNDVLRTMAQAGESVVNAIGEIPAPVLSAGLVLAGLTGAVALLGGGLITIIPKVAGTVQAIHSLAPSASRARSALGSIAPAGGRARTAIGRVGKAAGVAGLALAGLSIAAHVFTDEKTKSAEEYGNAILKVSDAGNKAKSSDLDSMFQGWTKFAGMATSSVDSTAEAVQRLSNQDFGDGVQKFFRPLAALVGAPKAEIGQLEDRIKGLGDELGNLVSSGKSDAAAKTFSTLADSFTKSGKSAQTALDYMPGYRDALLATAQAAGVSLSPQELLNYALGEMPPKLEAAIAAQQGTAAAADAAAQKTADLADGLKDAGVAADGTVSSVDKLTESLLASGLITLSARQAGRQYEQAVDDVDDTINQLIKDNKSLTGVLTQNGKAFNTTTEAGRKAEAAFDGVSSAGLDNAQAMAKNGSSQKQVQGSLTQTYRDLIKSGQKFGLNAAQAENMARKVMGIPKGVKVSSWMSDAAKRMAEKTKRAIDSVDGTTATVYTNLITRKTTIYKDVHEARSHPLSKGPKAFYTGGTVGFASGGTVPGSPPANPTIDNVAALTQNGTPYRIRSGEEIINEPQAEKNRPWLKAINAGLDLNKYMAGTKYGLASGGTVRGREYQSGRPYGYVGDASLQTQGPVTAVLSARDRQLLYAVASRPVDVSVGGRQFARAVADHSALTEQFRRHG